MSKWLVNMCIVYIYIPGTPMTLILNGKGLLLEGSTAKIEDKQVPGIYIYIINDSLKRMYIIYTHM